MDSHQPADPWGITEVPNDDADGVVATAPREPEEGPMGPEGTDQPDVGEPTPVVEETTEETASVDSEVVEGTPEVPTDLAEPEPTEDAPGWTADSVVAEATELIAEVEEAGESAEPIVDPTPKFDLGLDEDSGDTWGEDAADFEVGTAFDLIPPSAEGDEVPQYEVEEPELSEEFVATSPEGRPDVGMPHLADPDPLLAVPEESMPESAPEPEEEPTASFRLPGLFGRRKITDPVEGDPVVDGVDAPTDGSSELSPVDSIDVPAPADVPAAEEQPDEADVPPMPSAWESNVETTDEPDSPFSGFAAVEPDNEPEVEEVGAETEFEVESDTDTPVVESDEEPVEEPIDDATGDGPVEAANVVELPVVAAVAEPDGEDTMEIELTEPDLSELEDQDQLYVTEDSHEDRPTALLTVDTVPGATIAQAVDVVTAVASASTEDEIAGAMERVLGQLRDKAHDLGGEAVISVHTEVQEMGGGFLVTGSGTAVTLA